MLSFQKEDFHSEGEEVVRNSLGLKEDLADVGMTT